MSEHKITDTALSDEELAQIALDFDKANEMVGALCKHRLSAGSREWTMSIPARPDYDPDLVIGRALHHRHRLLAYIGHLQQRLRQVETVELPGQLPKADYGSICEVCHESVPPLLLWRGIKVGRVVTGHKKCIEGSKEVQDVAY